MSAMARCQLRATTDTPSVSPSRNETKAHVGMHDTMPDEDDDRTPGELKLLVEAALENAWVGAGYTAPNNDVYPWMWLWDSCFHSIIWAELGRPSRALAEIGSVLALQDRSGFVPHMGYQINPDRAVEIWGRSGESSITQPPMYAHTLAELARHGLDVSGRLIDCASRGLRFLLEDRARTADGLVMVVHPWETGCDDSPRWDDLCPGDHHDPDRWRSHKMDLLATIERGPHGEPISNPRFLVGSIGFNSLIAFNALELAELGNDEFLEPAVELIETIDARWDPERSTWTDSGVTESGSGRARTVDALLPLLVTGNSDKRMRAVRSLVDPAAHGSEFGPLGVHRLEPFFAPDTYWRGPVWPQLAYLLWVGLSRSGDAEETLVANSVASSIIRGAMSSGLAEYWNGDSGRGLGASPQSWTGLALVMTTG